MHTEQAACAGGCSWGQSGYISPFCEIFFPVNVPVVIPSIPTIRLFLSEAVSPMIHFLCTVFSSPYYFPVQSHRGITQPHHSTPVTLIAVPAGGNRRYVI